MINDLKWSPNTNPCVRVNAEPLGVCGARRNLQKLRELLRADHRQPCWEGSAPRAREQQPFRLQVPVESARAGEEEEDPTFCEVCGRSDREDRLLLCDGCDAG